MSSEQRAEQSVVLKEGCLEIHNLLAGGGESEVYKGKLDGESVAIKVFQEEEYYQNERTILRKSYPHVIKMVGDSRVGDFNALVFELLDQDISTLLNKCTLQLRIQDIHTLAEEILAALSAIHADGITHNDIKPENIMLEKYNKQYILKDQQHTHVHQYSIELIEPVFKLIDFAYASFDPVVAGTQTYYAPEELVCQEGVMRQFGSQLQHNYRLSTKIDIWELGLVLFEAAVGHRLFDQSNDLRRFVAILRASKEELVIPETIIEPRVSDLLDEYTSKELTANRVNESDERMFARYVESSKLIKDKYPVLYDLLQHMLVIDPTQRYTVHDCLEHSFVREKPIQKPGVIIKNIHEPLQCNICGCVIKRADRQQYVCKKCDEIRSQV